MKKQPNINRRAFCVCRKSSRASASGPRRFTNTCSVATSRNRSNLAPPAARSRGWNRNQRVDFGPCCGTRKRLRNNLHWRRARPIDASASNCLIENFLKMEARHMREKNPRFGAEGNQSSGVVGVSAEEEIEQATALVEWPFALPGTHPPPRYSKRLPCAFAGAAPTLWRAAFGVRRRVPSLHRYSKSNCVNCGGLNK